MFSSDLYLVFVALLMALSRRLAQHLGLVVYVTVGTEDKRQLLIEQYNIPEEHIFHSRNASFVKVRNSP